MMRGLTLVELMVAVALGGLITIAAISVLVMSRKGFAAVDAASQLQENGRFAADIIQRLALQAGYRDVFHAATLHPDDDPADVEPGIGGFNNATPVASDPAHRAAIRSAAGVGYGSDVLVVRYQASSVWAGSSIADEGMIDCAGNPVEATPGGHDQVTSILHVASGPDGEPALMCTVVSAKGPGSPQPLVKGVENFQVLYGVDSVIPKAAPVMPADKKNFTGRYLRADELLVAGDEQGTAANWRRVRSLRIGLVLRSSATAGHAAESRPIYPLGIAPSSDAGMAGSAFASDSDAGSIQRPGRDGRLRQSITFTANLRNEQDV